MPDELLPSPGLKGDSPAAALPQGLVDRRELAFIAVERTRMPMMVSDPRQPDNPIVLANQAFLNLTGYGSEEVLGRNCRFLQGADTDPAHIDEMRRAVVEERELDLELLNYRKDGTPFWNQLHISPIHDDQGRLIYFFASQVDSTEQHKLGELEKAERRLLREVDHRAMNVLAIVEGIVRLSRADNAKQYAAAVQRRVQALARAHTILAQRGWRDVPLAHVIETQVGPFAAGRVDLNGPEVLLLGHLVQPLAIVFHELVANAATHGALSREGGTVRVEWEEDPDTQAIDLAWSETGGPAPATDPQPGFGSTMIGAIVNRQLRGSFKRTWRPDGLRAHFKIPTRLAA